MGRKSALEEELSLPKKSDDAFELPHLGDYLGLGRLESTYRTKSGAPLPDGVSSPPRPDRHDMGRLFVHDEDRVLVKVVHYGHPTSAGIETDENGEWQFRPMWARRAGPRAWIYFRPEEVKAAILTSGGLCPGLNDVIRQIVSTLEIYGVSQILGIQYGFRGFSDPKLPPIALNRKVVQRINMQGGSFLGVTRGGPKISEIVDKLEAWKVNMLFVIGGNGSHAGANAIFKEVWARKLKLAVVGVPKTIDNDFLLVDKSFGFDTAVEEAQRAINAAYVEASSAFNGVGIVKLMGRHSGFIAMHATLASGQVDVVLIPEVPFMMDGNNGVLAFMKKRLERNGICVVVVAEGAGQDLLEKTGAVDASGNTVLADVGKWFYSQVKAYFSKIKMSADVKYIDPTYMIRARPCNSADHIFCSVLGQNAVHAAFAGYSNVTVGLVNTHYCLLPIPVVIKHSRFVDPNSNMWHRCVTSTGQPDFCNTPPSNQQTRPATAAAAVTPSEKPKAVPATKPSSPSHTAKTSPCPSAAKSACPSSADPHTAGKPTPGPAAAKSKSPSAPCELHNKEDKSPSPSYSRQPSPPCHLHSTQGGKPTPCPSAAKSSHPSPAPPPSASKPTSCPLGGKGASQPPPQDLHTRKDKSSSPPCSNDKSPSPPHSRDKSSLPPYSRDQSPSPPSSRDQSPSPPCSRDQSPSPPYSRSQSPSPPCSRGQSPSPPSSRPPSPPGYLHSTLDGLPPPIYGSGRPATAPATRPYDYTCRKKPGCRMKAQPISGDVEVKVFLHYCKGKPSECVGVVQLSDGVFEWPTVAVHKKIWEAGGDILVQALYPKIASWYSELTGAKALQAIFLTYAGIIQGERVAQFRLPPTPHNIARWSGGLFLLHPDVLEARLHVPLVPSVRTLTGNPCKF